MLAFRGAGAEPPRRTKALRLWGLTCPASPAGVEQPSAPITKCSFFNHFKNNLLEKSLSLRNVAYIVKPKMHVR